MLQLQPPVEVMCLDAVIAGERIGLDIGGQEIAGMFQIGPYTRCIALGRLLGLVEVTEPILSLDVVCLLFVGAECSRAQCHRVEIIEPVPQFERPEVGAEQVAFGPVKVDLELAHRLQRAKPRSPVGRDEVVAVLREVADETYLPSLGRLPSDVGLIVYEVGVIFAFGVHRAQQVAARLIAQAVCHREVLVAISHVCRRPEQAHRGRCLECFGPAVGDVEHRCHLVAIFCFVSSR